jgi:hypothetical protein
VRLAALLGTIALCVAIGAVTIGYGVVLPTLGAQTHLIDANLSRALAEPIALRLAEILLGASIVLALAAPCWLKGRLGTTLALALVMATTANRVLMAPAVYAAWARVDLVAGRPMDRLARAQELAQDQLWLVASTLALLLGLVWLAVHVTSARAPLRAAAQQDRDPVHPQPQTA